MLSQPAQFPFIGSQGFERGTGRPLTIIQHRADGRALTRRDDVPRASRDRPGPTEGNATLLLADICESHAAALKQRSGRANQKALKQQRAKRQARK